MYPKTTRSFSILLITVLMVTAVLASPVHAETVRTSSTFKDVPLLHPYYMEITALSKQQVILGNTDGSFRPDQAIKPGHVSLLLKRILDADQDYKQIMKEFNPPARNVFTHEQAAGILVQAFELEDTGAPISFEDEADFSDSLLPYAKILQQHVSQEQSAFQPQAPVSRGQFVYYLYHLTHNQPDVIPLEDFFRKPDKTSFSPSPNGEYLAYLQPWQNRLNIYVQHADHEEAVRITSEVEQDILYFGWLTDSRLLYIYDSGGDENYNLYAADIDGTNVTDLTPYENTVAQPLDLLPDHEDEILIQMNKRDPRFFDVYRLNIHTAELTMVAENPGFVTGWLTDHDGKVRVATATDENEATILYRETEDDEFQVVLETDFNDVFYPVVFTSENSSHVYAISNLDRDKAAVVQFDLSTGTIVDTIFEHPDVDVSSIQLSDRKERLISAMYITDKVHFHFFDEDRKRLQEKLEKHLPGYEVNVLSISEDEKTVMLLASNDKSQGTYYYYDVNTDKLSLLSELSPWLNEEELADMQPIQYTSRDGLTIHGYLTLPKGKEAKNLPVVVNPHGGPWARDVWGYNAEVQFLVSRGYAVLQMDFRGSGGYGKEFLNAGNKEWGKAMQDDITDGVQWLIEKGIADPDRIAIYGGSYGGYAALAGVTFTPDLYAAGVSYVGPSNLFTLLDSLPPYWESGRQMFYSRVGHPVEDRERLEAASPLFHVDQITAPLFIAQGANDPRVKQAESDQIVEALRERGIDVPYLLKENEGHGFRNQENVFDFYRALERFLATHLLLD